MHGIEHFFIGIANSLSAIWGGRALLFRPTLFDEPKARRRSQIISTALCLLATAILLGIAAGVLWLLYWVFTSHERL